MENNSTSWMSLSRQSVSRSLIWREGFSENLVRKGKEFWGAYFLAYEDSHLYIADFDNSRIQIWSVDGAFQKSFPLSFKPRGVALLNHVLFISNEDGHLIHVYSKEGKELNKWGSQGSTHGQFNSPTGLCCDDNNLYVADYYNHRIAVFA